MNTVVQYQPQAAAPAPAFTMSEMERIALAIAKGRLFGSDDPNAVLTLCMVAQAEGKHPGLVMQQYHIIKGKPAKKAEAMLVDFLAAGGKVQWNKLDDECADATFSHPLGGEVTINWTIARATKAGLLNNDTWKKYPRQMLRSRVVSEGVRTVFPGATSGMYVPEEVQDFDDAPAARTTPAMPQPKRARDLQAEQPAIEDKTDLNRANAEAWTAEFVGKLADTDVDGATALFAKSANAITKLEREHPDLAEQVNAHRPTETPADALLTRAKADLAAAPDGDAVEALIADLEQHRGALSDEQLRELEVAYSKARTRVSEPEMAK